MKQFIKIFLSYYLAVFFFACNTPAARQETHDTRNAVKDAAAKPAKTIVFFGNSLTAGYGLDPAESFPSLIQVKLDSLHLPYKVVNAGVSGETTSGGNSRVDWILRQPVDIFVLELGGNDGLRGIPLAETRKNLQSIVDKVKRRYPAAKIILAGMQIPPNMGQDYASGFSAIFTDLAKKNSLQLIPFLLDRVGGIKELNQADGIHPTAAGAKLVAGNVWNILKEDVSE